MIRIAARSYSLRLGHFFVMAAMSVIAAPQARANDIGACLSTSLLTEDVENFINQAIIPDVPARFKADLKGNLGGGKDPSVSVSPIDISIVTGNGGRQVVELKLHEIKVSARFGDNGLFAGPRVGIRGPVTVRASLGVENRRVQDNNPNSAIKPYIVLKDYEVKTAFRVDLGGTFGHFLGQLFTALANGFGVNGKLGRTITQELGKLKIAPALYNSSVTVVQADGTRKIVDLPPISIKDSNIKLTPSDICLTLDVPT